jgi:hypothetical protein
MRIAAQHARLLTHVSLPVSSADAWSGVSAFAIGTSMIQSIK